MSILTNEAANEEDVYFNFINSLNQTLQRKLMKGK